METTQMELALLFDDDNKTCVAMTSQFRADHPFYKTEMNITMTTNNSVDKTTIGLKLIFNSAVMCNEKRVTIFFCYYLVAIEVLQNSITHIFDSFYIPNLQTNIDFSTLCIGILDSVHLNIVWIGVLVVIFLSRFFQPVQMT